MNPLRVLHLGTEKQWRGGENQIRLLALGAQKQGVESHIAYPKSSVAFPRFESMGPSLALPSRSPIDPRNILAIRNYCGNNEIDIIDAHSSAAMTLGLAVKRLLPHLKLVVHRRVAFPIKNSFFSRKKYLNPHVDRYVAISKYISTVLIEAGVDPAKVYVVPSAIDTDLYEGLHRDECHKKMVALHKLDPSKPIIGMTSALTKEKGHDIVLWALTHVERPFQFLVLGDGDQKDHLLNLVNSTGLKGMVQFLGRAEDIKPFMKSLDVFLMPSRFEGLGTSVLEAMSAGVMVIGSNTGGIPEMIKHGETGLLAEVDDINDWAEKIDRALNDFDLRARCIQAAKAHIKSHFSLDVMVQGNVAVYRSLCQ
jgi:glycosyltransferase involved in cell wall biosynthesis